MDNLKDAGKAKAPWWTIKTVLGTQDDATDRARLTTPAVTVHRSDHSTKLPTWGKRGTRKENTNVSRLEKKWQMKRTLLASPPAPVSRKTLKKVYLNRNGGSSKVKQQCIGGSRRKANTAAGSKDHFKNIHTPRLAWITRRGERMTLNAKIREKTFRLVPTDSNIATTA